MTHPIKLAKKIRKNIYRANLRNRFSVELTGYLSTPVIKIFDAEGGPSRLGHFKATVWPWSQDTISLLRRIGVQVQAHIPRRNFQEIYIQIGGTHQIHLRRSANINGFQLDARIHTIYRAAEHEYVVTTYGLNSVEVRITPRRRRT